MTQVYKVQLSMNQRHLVDSGFTFKQGDFGFQIEIEVVDFDVTGVTPQIIFRKSTGAVESTSVTASGNKFTYTMRGTELDTPGPAVCDLKLKNNTTQRISTASFRYFVEADTMDGLNQQANSYSDTIAQIVGGFDEEIELLDFYVTNNINKHKNPIDFSRTTGKIMNREGVINDAGDSHYVVSSEVNASAGEIFEINVTMKYSNNVISFYGSNDSYLGGINSEEGTDLGNSTYKFENYDVIAPDGTVKVRFGYHSSYAYGFFNVTGSDFESAETKNVVAEFSRIVVPNTVNRADKISYEISYGYITQYGTRVDATEGKWRLTESKDYIYGEKYVINAYMSYDNAVVAFYDSNNTFIGCIHGSDGTTISTNLYQFTNYEVTVPENASKIVFGYYQDSDSDALKAYKILGIINEDLYKDFSRSVVANSYTATEHPVLTINNGCVINANTGIEATGYGESWKDTDAIDCIYGEKYVINAYMSYDNAVVAFYDSNNTFIGCIHGSDGTTISTNLYQFTNYEVTVPFGAVKMRFGLYKDQSHQTFNVTKYTVKLIAGSEDELKWVGKKWVVVGDSLSDPTNATATKYYFDYISEKTGITLYNMGDSGTGYARKQDMNAAFYQRILNCPLDADVITIFGSFNDISAGLDLGTISDSGTTTLAGCINKTIDNLQSVLPLANLGIVSPCPWQSTQPQESGTFYNYVDMLKRICEHRSIPYLDLWRTSGLRPWDADFRALAYTRDNGGGTHPDETGHAILAPKFEAFLDQLLLH